MTGRTKQTPSMPAALGLLCALAQVCAATSMATGDEPAGGDATTVTSAATKTTASDAKDTADFFGQRVQPFFSRHCVTCHGGKEPKADLDLNKFRDASSIAGDREIWAKLVEYLEADIMPPEERPRPDPSQVDAIVRWVNRELARLDAKAPRNPGRVTIRRLNRAEYNNTIRDLVGIDFQPADDFPSDDVGYGFDNIGDVLSMPPILMEKYLAAAEQIAERAIVVPQPSKRSTHHVSSRDLLPPAEGEPQRGRRVLYGKGEVYAELRLAPGDALLRVKAYSEQAGGEPVRMALRVNRKDIKTVDVKAGKSDSEAYEASFTSTGGKQRVAVAFLNDYYRPDDPDPAQRDRNLCVRSIEVDGIIETDPAPLPESHRRIIFRQPTEATQDECTREIMARFAARAYRRPATDDEVGRLVRLVRLATQQGDPLVRGIQLAVQAVLVSPHFLFRVELSDHRLAGNAATGDSADNRQPPDGAVERLNDYQLASRLSYFLWSTMPDDELFALAAAGKLSQKENLEAQARRMLADAKSRTLVDNFAGQWLQIRNLNLAAPDRKRFPSFDEPLRTAMRRETELFFESIVREDRSVLDLLDADYTFVNERLAKHYGIAGVKGDEFRRVQLGDPRRGGVLAQASILTVTSNPTRTSPVKRGKWILEQILGTPPPPPPPEVPELEAVKLEGVAASEDGTASRQPKLRGLPRPHGPAGIRPGELRRHRGLARQGRLVPDRRLGNAAGRAEV